MSVLRRPYSPSELAAVTAGTQVRVGGRVRAVAPDAIQLADAFGAITVQLAHGEPAVREGDLILVTLRWEGDAGVEGRLVARFPARPGNEFGRFAGAGVGRALAARAVAVRALREYFAAEGFLEVETPVRVRCPGLDAYVDAVRAEHGFLVTSPEHHMKRLLVGGLPRIYQLARCSRVDESGPLHEPEFTLLEWYRAFEHADAVMGDTEALVAAIAEALSGARRVTVAGRTVDVSPPFERLAVRDAFREHAGVADAADLAASDEARYFQTFVDRVEPALALLPRPVFLTRFPATQAALARPCPDDPTVAERFELILGGVELCNGFGELTDPVEQRRRFEVEAQRRAREGRREQPVDETFLLALEEGMPPSAGNALGFDRLVALALGESSIQRVMAFPGEVPATPDRSGS